jgi:hypothetical protein
MWYNHGKCRAALGAPGGAAGEGGSAMPYDIDLSRLPLMDYKMLLLQRDLLPGRRALLTDIDARFAAVAARAVGGSAVSFPWKTGPALALAMVGFVFAGKAAGGYLCDRLGAKRTALLSLPAAAVLIAFCSAWMLPALAGQFLLNLTMPVTLWLIYRAMPDSPGLAFGLAASALWPGAIAGGLFRLTGPALWLCVLVTFLSGLLSILYSDKKIKILEVSK